MRLITASEKCITLSDFADAREHLNRLARKRSTQKVVRPGEEELVAGSGEPCEVNVLSEELEVERKRFAERHVESEERVLVSQASHIGEVVQRGQANGWVGPLYAELMHETVRVQLRAMNDDFRAKPSGSESSSNAVVTNTDGSMADTIGTLRICARPSSSKEDIESTSSVMRFIAGHRVVLNHRR